MKVNIVTILILIDGFLQYYMDYRDYMDYMDYRGHNPYFNRWFSAIIITIKCFLKLKEVTILILIDGFLQYNARRQKGVIVLSQSLF